ncbi:YcjX family protein [Thalassotalea sp. G2M2-11]|uniref:YcjX family protein n=1 Tax=Thalassotalea sp. G2M2-11 TaxID=2787627 RepID=UPI001F49EC74|nr:YcjX family protein [Thalassotalea sp. G2M2-11]
MVTEQVLFMALINKETIERLKQKTNDLVNRTLDKHINLAVTGLSRSGKTAFITSFVNQLVNENSQSQLDFFSAIHQGRFIAAKRVPQKNLHIARFEYDKAMAAFSNEPPSWPEPTQGISELRLAIRYQPENSLLKYATDTVTLYVDITDYPGEWLLDLPLLDQTFEQWSEATTELLQQPLRAKQAQGFLTKVAELDPFEPVDEEKLASLSQEYTQLLLHYRHELGLSVIQPGRFILPGDLAGAPILQFFPFTEFAQINIDDYQSAGDDTLIGMLRARYLEYKERVVKAFYKQHFVNFDRQIILADCLTPLNAGQDSFNDLQQALNLIMKSFDYGKSDMLTRLFSPKIDKLLFAATKADHVTPEQHQHLMSLLDQLVHQTKHQLSFDEIKMSTQAIASVKATKAGQGKYQGKNIPVIQGKALADNKLVTLFPGAVPSTIPKASYWQEKSFNYLSFAPLETVSTHHTLPHLRMDQVFEFLLGDKMT